MKIRSLILALLAAALLLPCSLAQAKIDTVEQYADAVMTANIPELERLLAPNFWYIGGNGHIRDKENFIKDIKDKVLVVNRLTLTNERETKVGDTRLVTANGNFKGTSAAPRPQGLMRYTLVLANNNGKEQVALFQATPVLPSDECPDGNCRIK